MTPSDSMGRRVVLAIVVAGIVPFVAGLLLGNQLIMQTSAACAHAQVIEHLERIPTVYGDLVKATKTSMRHEAEAIAMRLGRRIADRAATPTDPENTETEALLDEILGATPHLVSLTLKSSDGAIRANRTRKQPPPRSEQALFTVRQPLDEGQDTSVLLVVFEVDPALAKRAQDAREFAAVYRTAFVDMRSGFMERPIARVYGLIYFVVCTVSIAIAFVVAGARRRRR